MERMNEIEELNLLNNRIEDLKMRIELLSKYDPEVIGNIICKLMTAYEGCNYELKVDDNVFTGKKYDVVAEENPELKVCFRLFSFNKEENSFYDTFDENRKDCFLFPSYYDIGDNDDVETENSEEEVLDTTEYLRDFTDFLFEERSKDNKLEVDSKYLEEKLNKFLDLNKEEILSRKKEEIIIDNPESVLDEYLDTCVVERRAILNSIKYLLNHYSENTATEEIDEENVTYNNCRGKKVDHQLKIYNKVGGRAIRVNHVITYPIDAEKIDEDYINFNSLKQGLGEELLGDCPVLDDFLYNVEDMFKDDSTATREDINNLLEYYKEQNIDKKLVLKNNK